MVELALAPLRQLLSSIEDASPLRRAEVTVLFADIVGSTAKGSSPEVARRSVLYFWFDLRSLRARP